MNNMRIRWMSIVIPIALLGACGGGQDLSPAAAQGLEVARSNGCTACHGVEGQGGVGPAWQGLFGSQVELEDGSTVTADRDYLVRSIQDPQAQLVAGYTTKMPENELSTDQIDSVIAYIEELAE